MAKSKQNIDIRNLTRAKLPRFPWEKAKDKVLGQNYNLSLVFVGNQRSRRLNLEYRGKDKPANVLSFSLDKQAGEIFLNPNSTENLFYLFIHGLLHLAGYDHGSKMEHTENRLSRFFGFNFNEKRDRRGIRHRDSLHPGNRGRARSH